MPHLYNRSSDTSIDSLPIEIQLNNDKYNELQPPAGLSASLDPRFSNSSRSEANKRCVRSAFGCHEYVRFKDVLQRMALTTHLLAAGNKLIDQHRLTILCVF